MACRFIRSVQRGVALGVVAHEHLGKGGIESCDVPGEVGTVFKLELVRAALFDGQSRDAATWARVTQDGRAELLVHQDACGIERHTLGQRLPEAFVDQLLAVDDLLALRHGSGGLKWNMSAAYDCR